VLVWALGVVGILFLTLFGRGALFGSASDIFVQMSSLQNLSDVQATEALSIARGAAGWAIVGLVAYLVAAIAGGMMGVKTGSKDDLIVRDSRQRPTNRKEGHVHGGDRFHEDTGPAR
jgi:hypothetical protein